MEFKVGDKVKIRDSELPIIDNWLGEGNKITHQGPFIIEELNHRCVEKMSGIRVMLGFNRFELYEEIDLLEQAKLKYPVGTVYKCAADNNCDCTVKENVQWKFWNSDNDKIKAISHYFVYCKGKWAEIISKPEVEESKSLVGRYLKALVDRPNAGAVKQGEYGLITSEYFDNIPNQVDFPSQQKYSIDRTTYERGGSYELMPEGFTPDSIKPQFEVGKWYKCKWNTHPDNPIYIKPTKVESGNIECEGDTSIWTIDKSIYKNGSYAPSQITIIEKLTDLSEIQQYLPTKHSDKINKIIKYKAIPFPKESYIELEVIRELKSEYDIDIPVGSKTWVEADYENNIGTEKSVHIEKNRYLKNFKGINFRFIRSVNIEESVTDRVEAMVQSVIDQPKFKIGDKVKAIDESGGWGRIEDGDIGVVKKNDLAGRWKYSVDFPNHTNWSCNEKDLELYNESKMTVTFNPSQNAVPVKLAEYPVTPVEAYQVIGNLKSKRNSNKLDTNVKSTYVSLPEVKKKSKTIKF